MKSYIGPAQILPGATLQSYCNTQDEKYCAIERTVDVARLRDLAFQNILSLFYFILLYEPKDRPYMMVWHNGGGMEEGRFVQGLYRDPVTGDAGLHFSLAKGSIDPAVTVMLSRLLLIEDITGEGVPAYVLDKLNRRTQASGDDHDALIKTRRRTAAQPARARRTTAPNPYLRHPVSGETVTPLTHTEFFRFARGHVALPKPYIIEAGGLVVMQETEAA